MKTEKIIKISRKKHNYNHNNIDYSKYPPNNVKKNKPIIIKL